MFINSWFFQDVMVIARHPLSPAARAFRKIAHTLLGRDYVEKFSVSDMLSILMKKY